MVIGYIRVPSSAPNVDTAEQVHRLLAAGADDVVSERTTASAPRDCLVTAMDRFSAGDTLLVESLGALGNSVADIYDTVDWLQQAGVRLRVLDLGFDTDTAAGKTMARTIGGLAEFNAALRRERQLEGIAKAKAEGRYKGRPPSIDTAKVRDLQAEGLGASEIATRLGIGRASVYRAMKTAGSLAHAA